jgi:LAO/AO transport system kinase
MAISPDIATLARKLRAGDPAILARGIMLIESKRVDHQKAAHHPVQELHWETCN